MRVTLHVVAGPQTGRDFTFDQHDTFMIGRSEDAQFCLPHDRFFSRHHCILEIAPPQCFLRDLSSTNGTFVNGIRVETAHLKHGDRIQGGETVLEVEVAADASEAQFNPFGKYEKDRAVADHRTLPELRRPVERRGLHGPTPSFRSFATIAAKSCARTLSRSPGYQMMRVLGQGGMGSVMLARSERDGRAVAIKTLLPEVAVSEQSLKRFMREIEVAASLQHQHIVSYIEHGTHNGIVYLVTEYVSGMDASKLAKQRGGKLNFKEVAKILEQILSALDFAHSKGFVHRDIKEQNILVDGSFPNYLSKLTDLGCRRATNKPGMSGVTMVGDVAGTIAYMPPEQVRDFKEVPPAFGYLCRWHDRL
jgi:serine/threonine-protein kinase